MNNLNKKLNDCVVALAITNHYMLLAKMRLLYQ